MQTLTVKLTQAFQSKTVWLVVVTLLINIIPAIRNAIPIQYLPFVDAFLALLTTLTHLFSNTDYSAPVVDNSLPPVPPVVE